MKKNNMYTHWKLEQDSNGYSWLAFDLQDKTANILTKEALLELEQIIDRLYSMDNYQGLVIYSLKKAGFIFGADILNFVKYSKEQIEELLELGQGLYAKLEKLPNTIALINGLCLGGGTELVLACKYRILANDAKVGLPEVTLGILPGWGGTVRLPKLVGSYHAVTMMITGKAYSAKKCKSIGLADVVVPSRQLRNAARIYLQSKNKLINAPLYEYLFKFPLIRRLSAKYIRSKLAKKVNKMHYPAPFAIIKNWAKITMSDNDKFSNERKFFIKLISETDTAKNLIRVYSLQQLLKKQAHGKTNIKHVHVVGAGVMGGEIAAWCSSQGFKVTFSDANIKSLAAVIQKAEKLYRRKFKITSEYQGAFDRLIPDYNSYGIKSADIIIEAVSEELPIKHAVWRNIDKSAKAEAIFATNTSSLPLSQISSVLTQPKRLIGVHFFNPVSRMPLVEVIHDNNQDEEYFQESLNFVKAIGKLPLAVKSSPGFLVNRILMPYIVGSFKMLDEGFSKEEIDISLKNYGMPMGPLELADTVGLDICLSVGKKMQDILNIEISELIPNLVTSGKFGKKTGSGIYSYKNGKIVRNIINVNQNRQKDIADRLIGQMYAAAKECLQNSVVDSEDLLDAGMIFGTGFAPFRGGLINACKKNNE